MFNPITWVKNIFAKVQSTFPSFVKMALTQASLLILGKSKEIVVEIVQELNSSDLSNSKKMQEALARLTEILKKEGKEVGESALRLLVELAVSYVKTLKE